MCTILQTLFKEKNKDFSLTKIWSNLKLKNYKPLHEVIIEKNVFL